MKNKARAIVIIGLLLLSGCGRQAAPSAVPEFTTIPEGQFYFYADGCSHCANVATFVANNNVKQKVFYVPQNISTSEASRKLLIAVGRQCNISEANLGVPLFFDGKTCYIGDDNVISYFKSLP